MKKRHGIGRQKSKKMFTRHAMHSNRRNMYSPNPMRGGIRL